MSVIHRVAKNTGILYARMAITFIISMYSTRLILTALGASDFGLFAVVGGLISMLGFLNSSMAAATQRFMSFAQGAGDLEKVKRIFNMSTLLHWGIAILVFFLLEGAGYFFFNGVLNIAPDRIGVAKIIYQFMVVSTLFTVISVPYEAVITSHENMMVYAILGIIEAILKLGIALYITYSAQDHLVAYGFLMAALSIFILILRRMYCHRYYAECVLKLRHYYDKPLLKEMSGFAGWSFLGSSSSMLANYGIGPVLNIFFGTLINAASAIAGQLGGILSVFSNTLLAALVPTLTKSEGAGNREFMLKSSLLGCKLSFFLLALFFLPASIEMPLLLKIWIKNVPHFTVIFCTLSLLKTLIEQLYTPLISAIKAVGNIKAFEISHSILNLAPILTAIVLFNLNLEPYYLHLSFLFFTVLSGVNTVYFAKLTCGLNVDMYLKDVFIRALVSFSIIFCLVYLVSINLGNIYIKFIVTFSANFIFSALVYWFIGFTKAEKEKLRELFQIILLKVGLRPSYKQN